MKWYNGEKKSVSLWRMRCTRCRRRHIELPDILVPNKHYAAEIIENVGDGISAPEDLSTEDFPCERTMQRWNDWIRNNIPQIDGYLKSIGNCVSVSGSELVRSGDLLVPKAPRWRRRLAGNSEPGHLQHWRPAPGQTAPGAVAPALFFCPGPP